MSWHTYRTKLVRLIVFFVLCLTVGLVRRFQLLHPPTPHLNRIHGRWAAVRTSLGLAPLPHAILVSPDPISPSHPDKRASRFDLGSKRRAEEEATARRLPPLHFAPDARLAQAALAHPDRKKEASTSEKVANAVSFSVLAAS